MTYSQQVQNMCPITKGPKHGPAPIPEEGAWVKAYEIKDISGYTHGVGWCAPQHQSPHRRFDRNKDNFRFRFFFPENKEQSLNLLQYFIRSPLVTNIIISFVNKNLFRMIRAYQAVFVINQIYCFRAGNSPVKNRLPGKIICQSFPILHRRTTHKKNQIFCRRIDGIRLFITLHFLFPLQLLCQFRHSLYAFAWNRFST